MIPRAIYAASRWFDQFAAALLGFPPGRGMTRGPENAETRAVPVSPSSGEPPT